MKIILLGYMGSGKSTIGKLLSKKLKMRFIDLDNHIEKVENSKISTLFKKKGEVYFRKLEAATLREIITSEDDFVLSIGGGTPCYANNMEAISKITANGVYLQVGLVELVDRLKSEKADRPLIADVPNDDLPEFIGKHLFERSFFYNQANYTINCDGKSAEQITTELSELFS